MTAAAPAPLPSGGPDPITDARARLARRFCRVVAVIDDEIEDKDEPNRFTEAFGALRKRFDEESIICHLHHYPTTHLPPDDETNAPLVTRALEIAAAADLVVIDWHLGMTDDPSHALSVIRGLADRAGIRFVLINTRVEPREPARKIQESLGAVMETVPGENTELIRLRIGEHFFLSIRQKAGTTDDAASLLSEAQGWLSTTFPDHLHWAGLEIAVRVREMLPKVVAAMPKGTNGALAHQLLFQRNDEIAEQITEVFLDELKLHFKTAPLAAVSDKILFESLKTAMQKLATLAPDLEAVHEEFEPGWAASATSAENKNAEIRRYKSARRKVTPVPDATTGTEGAASVPAEPPKPSPQECSALSFRQRLRQMGQIWATPALDPLRVEKTRKKHFPSLGDRPEAAVTAAYLKKAFSATDASFEAWASLKESAQLTFNGNEVLFPGCVLKRITPNESDPLWLLCITPACDCYWRKVKGYLFVIGTEQPAKSKSRPSQTQTWFRSHSLAWDAKALIVKAPAPEGATNVIDGYKIEGAVRGQFASRIIQRVWSYQSRVGVDTSEYYREIRGEF